jgi:hypothetical protein
MRETIGQLQRLAAYQEFLRSASLDDAGDFRTAIVEAQNLLGLTQTDLAKEFGCARGTVNRWSQGTALPYTGLRKVAFQHLARRASHRRRRLEKALSCGSNWAPSGAGQPVEAEVRPMRRHGADDDGGTQAANATTKAGRLVTAGIAAVLAALPAAA